MIKQLFWLAVSCMCQWRAHRLYSARRRWDRWRWLAERRYER